MEKLPICRICLVEGVRMCVVVNTKLHELYEKLTDIPFVTEDSRPILACLFCCTKLKQCYRLVRQCLQAEELLSQMMNDDYEPNSSINQDRLWFFSGFIKSPIVHMSLIDEYQTESIAIKEELPTVCEGLGEIIEPKEENLSEELEPENLNNMYLDVADNIPAHHSESDLDDYVPLIKIKTEVVEEQEVTKKKRRATSTKRATVAKKPKLDTRRTKLEDAVTAEPAKKEQLDSKIIRTSKKRLPNPGSYTRTQIGKKNKCGVCQRSFDCPSNLTYHIRVHTGEKPHKCDVCQHSFSQKCNLVRHIRIHTGEKPYKCDVCQRSFSQSGDLTKHMFVHTGEKPYNCDVCQRGFNQKSHLRDHILVHTGEKPYKCDVCQLSFSQNRELRNHIRKHTGEKPYKCDVCQRFFARKNILRKHIRIHTGEKPYKCDVCQRFFSRKNVLMKHIRIHTK